MNIKALRSKIEQLIETITAGLSTASETDDTKGEKTMSRDVFSELAPVEQREFMQAGGMVVESGGNTKRPKPETMDRDVFNELSPTQQSMFIRKKGELVDVGGTVVKKKPAPERMSRTDFDAMDPKKKLEFTKSGGKIVD